MGKTNPAIVLALGGKPPGVSAHDEPDEDDVEDDSAYEEHSTAASDLLDAVKSGNERDVKTAFDSLFRAALQQAETKGLLRRIAKEADEGDLKAAAEEA